MVMRGDEVLHLRGGNLGSWLNIEDFMIGLPFNYRLFEDDLRSGVHHDRGFVYLDRAIEWGRRR
jgi:hypothetical protein